MISIVTICPESYFQWLGECCNSVRNQVTAEKTEHILVTIGFECLREDVTNIHLHRDPGLSTCRNIGVAAAKGDYIMMLDSDDWLAPDFIEKVTPHLYHLNVVSGSIERFGDDSGVSLPPNIDEKFKFIIDLKSNNPIPYNAVFHRGLFPGYDIALNEMGYEDWDLWLTIENESREYDLINWVPAPEAILHYRVHKDSHTHRSWKHHEARMAYLREKHGVK